MSDNPGAVPDIDPTVPPSGTGCAECAADEGWWVHLRRCAACGHIGCCDTSPSQHASQHARESGHPIVRTFEPDEEWFYDYRTENFMYGPELPDAQHHPPEQPVPGPAGRVPPDWESQLN